MDSEANAPVQVLVAMDFSDAILDSLRAVSPRLRVERQFPKVPDKAWARAEVLYTGNVLPEPGQAPGLRWVQLHSAGVDHVAGTPVLADERVAVTTTSGIHAGPMAGHCLAMLLAFHYRLPLLFRQQARAEWRTTTEAGAELFSPRDLPTLTLGIAGYGSIGRELARLADGLGMRVLATKRDLMKLDDDDYRLEGTGDPDASIPERLYPPEALASMARECDYLVITLPLTEATRGSVTAAVLEAMKPTAVLINVGRGAVVDEAALIAALQARRLRGAALDVFTEEPLPASSPLWGMENVIVSPHVSGNSADYHERAAALFAENLERYLEGRPLLNRVKVEHGY